MIINWGWSGDLDDDLNNAGYKFKSLESKNKWYKLKEARSMLTIYGMLTDAETKKVIKRFSKAILADIERLEIDEG